MTEKTNWQLCQQYFFSLIDTRRGIKGFAFICIRVYTPPDNDKQTFV